MSGLDALAALHEEDRERGVDPFTAPRPAPPPQAPAPFVIPEFDGSSFVGEIVREPDPAPREDTEARPARPRESRGRWTAEQVLPDLGGAA